jgi:Flp pilus assembly protein TadD
MNEAEREFIRAKQLDPSNPRSYLALGTVFLLGNRPEQAAKEYRAYLKIVPRTPENQDRITEVERILQNLSSRQ